MKEKLKIERSSGNVFADIGFAPDEAQNLLLRSELMTRVERYVQRNGLSQTKATQSLGVTQPRLNDLMRGKIDKFSLDALVNMLGHAGMRVETRVKKAAQFAGSKTLKTLKTLLK